MKKNIKIIVAAHKNYQFPDDDGYLPLQVGRAISPNALSIEGDNSGDNISELNKNFCELTGLYWLWKNINADAYGLVHYRRYFKPLSDGLLLSNQHIATSDELGNMLEKYDIILSSKRNYWIETIQQHYKNAHYERDLNVLEAVIAEQCPEYSLAFSKVMAGRRLSLFNMFVLRSDLFNSYCDWLFSVLFEVETRISYKEYGPYQGRVFGFLAERLLNVWVEKNISQEKIKYLPVVNLEGENLFSKAVGLLKRKISGQKLA